MTTNQQDQLKMRFCCGARLKQRDILMLTFLTSLPAGGMGLLSMPSFTSTGSFFAALRLKQSSQNVTVFEALVNAFIYIGI